MLAAVCNMQGLWIFVGLLGESWRGVFLYLVFYLAELSMTVNLTVNLLWVVVVVFVRVLVLVVIM